MQTKIIKFPGILFSPEDWDLGVIDSKVIGVTCWFTPYKCLQPEPGVASNLNDPNITCIARGFLKLSQPGLKIPNTLSDPHIIT